MEKDNDAENFYARERTFEKKRKPKPKKVRVLTGPIKLTGLQKIYKFILFIFLIWFFLVNFDLASDPFYEYCRASWLEHEEVLRQKGDWETLAKYRQYYENRHMEEDEW